MSHSWLRWVSVPGKLERFQAMLKLYLFGISVMQKMQGDLGQWHRWHRADEWPLF